MAVGGIIFIDDETADCTNRASAACRGSIYCYCRNRTIYNAITSGSVWCIDAIFVHLYCNDIYYWRHIAACACSLAAQEAARSGESFVTTDGECLLLCECVGRRACATAGDAVGGGA